MQVFAYTGTSEDADVLHPVFGESCAVQTLTSSHDTPPNPFTPSMISDVDGDSCHDVTVGTNPDSGELDYVTTTLMFGDKLMQLKFRQP